MSNGDLNWGDDKRFFPRLTAFIQKWTQITFLKHVEPFGLPEIHVIPPEILFNFPLFWRKPHRITSQLLERFVVDIVRGGWITPERGVSLLEELRSGASQKPVVPVLHGALGWRRDYSSGEFSLSARLKVLPFALHD